MDIPKNSKQIQNGLYLYEYNKKIGDKTYTFRELYSTEGYCFYDNEEIIYDEKGSIILEPEIEDRRYTQYSKLAISASLLSIEELNNKYISTPIRDGMEVG